jgi:hypothetical protein
MKNLGDFRPGDICWQYAQIAPVLEEKMPADKIKLLVSDQHGILSKTIILPLHLFKSQFFADDTKPNFYFRKVRIEEINEQRVSFVRLDKKDNPLGSATIIKREIFDETYFIPQHEFGSS